MRRRRKKIKCRMKGEICLEVVQKWKKYVSNIFFAKRKLSNKKSQLEYLKENDVLSGYPSRREDQKKKSQKG
jgi:hypothetical protein